MRVASSERCKRVVQSVAASRKRIRFPKGSLRADKGLTCLSQGCQVVPARYQCLSSASRANSRSMEEDRITEIYMSQPDIKMDLSNALFAARNSIWIILKCWSQSTTEKLKVGGWCGCRKTYRRTLFICASGSITVTWRTHSSSAPLRDKVCRRLGLNYSQNPRSLVLWRTSSYLA